MVPAWLHGKRIAVFDLETDYIPTTQIFCNSVATITIHDDGSYNVTPAKVFTQYWTPYSHGSLLQSVTILNSCDYICAHNLMGFDLPELKRHLHVNINAKPLDTFILAKLVFTKDDLFGIDPQLNIEKDIWGDYSLKAFGQRFGDFKIDYSDFSHLNHEMAIYCNQDVDLATRLLIFLLEKPEFPLEKVVIVEHQVAAIIKEQTDFGFYIDIEKAKELNIKLLTEKLELETKLVNIFKPKFNPIGKIKTYSKLSKTRLYLPNEKYKKLIGTP